MSVEIEVHTVPHFKASIDAQLEPQKLECHGTFILYQAKPKLGRFLHKTGFVDFPMHTTVINMLSSILYLAINSIWYLNEL